MQEYKDYTGVISLDGKNLEKDDNGLNMIMSQIQRIFERLKERQLSLYSISMELKFIDTSDEQYINNGAEPEMLIDDNDLSRMIDFEDIHGEGHREFLKFLEESVYDWMNEEQWIEFSNKFIELYKSINWPNKVDIDNEEFDSTDYVDLNEILERHAISYRIRHVHTNHQVVHEHRRLNLYH